MSGVVVPIGPFTGGLNLNEDPSFIEDDQLSECVNFNVGRAGELVSRVGLKTVKTASNPIFGTTSGVPIIVLGSVVKPNLVSRLYVKQQVSPGVWGVFYSDNPESTDGDWNRIPISEYKAKDCKAIIQGDYPGFGNGVVVFTWFIPYGFADDPADEFNTQPFATIQHLSDPTFTGGYVSIPRGTGVVIFKNRMFIWGPKDDSVAGTSRVYYSSVGNYATWPVNNFFDVGLADGDHVQAIAIQGDALVIFKRNSTWSLFFETDPFLGTLRKINNEIGASNGNCVVTYQNELYLISRRSVHRLINLIFEDVGQNIALFKVRQAHQGTDYISVIGDKILCCIDTGNSAFRFRYFVYHTETGAWSEYTFPVNPDKFVYHRDFLHSLHQFATAGNVDLYHMHPTDTSDSNYGDSPDNITNYSFTTKKQAYGNIAGVKRLLWWGLEIISNAKSFSLFSVGNNNVLSDEVVHIHPTAGMQYISKGKSIGRFRTISYLFRSNAPFANFTIRSGIANITEKRDAFSGYPVPPT